MTSRRSATSPKSTDADGTRKVCVLPSVPSHGSDLCWTPPKWSAPCRAWKSSAVPPARNTPAGAGAPMRALAEPISSSWRRPPASTTTSRAIASDVARLPDALPRTLPSAMEPSPGIWMGAVAERSTAKTWLAASPVPSKTVEVTWFRGASSCSRGVPCSGVPASSSRRMRAKSNDSACPKPCGVWKASAVVVSPSIARRGRGDPVDGPAEADVADGVDPADAVALAVAVGVGAAGAGRDVDQRVVRHAHRRGALDRLAEGARAAQLGVRVLDVEGLHVVGDELDAVDVAAEPEVGQLGAALGLGGGGGGGGGQRTDQGGGGGEGEREARDQGAAHEGLLESRNGWVLVAGQMS